MAETELNIVLNAAGGDQARGEILKAADALSQTTASSGRLQEQFQHRFQHIGLMLFAGDALRASGLGAETRQVIGGLNTALIAGESAFGAAAGPAFLFVAALTAVAGIVVKVTGHHKNLVDSLDKTVTAERNAYQATLNSIDTVTKYNQVVGGAGGLLASEKALAALQQGELLSSQRQQVAAIQQLMESNITHAKVMSLLEDVYTSFEKVFVEGIRHVLEAIPGIGALVTAYELLKNKITQATSAFHMSALQYQINNAEADKLTKKNAELQVKMDQLLFSVKHGGAGWTDYMKSANDAFDQVAKDIQATEDSEANMSKFTEKVAKKMSADFTTAYQQIIFQQQNFGDVMVAMFTQMIEKMISEVIALITVWSILDIVSGGATGSPAGVGSLSNFLKVGMGFSKQALGGQYLVDKPTMFMAGEAGPEMASFTPMSQMGAGGASGLGGGGDTYVGPITINANGITDPKQFADMVGQEIVRSIRGQGQLNFARNA